MLKQLRKSKLAKVILAAVMAMSFCGTAFAKYPAGSSEPKGTTNTREYVIDTQYQRQQLENGLIAPEIHHEAGIHDTNNECNEYFHDADLTVGDVNNIIDDLVGNDQKILQSVKDTTIKSGSVQGNTLTLNKDGNGTPVTIDVSSLNKDTYVTNGSYNSDNQTITLQRNEGQEDINIKLDNIAKATDITELQGKVTTIEGNVTNLQSDVTNIKTDITNIQGDVTDLEGRVTTNEGNITTLQGDVTNIKTDVTNIKTDITNIQGDVTDLEGRVTTNEGNITTLQGDVTNIKTDVTNIKTDITNIQGDVTDLEGRVSTNETNITNLDNRVTTNETNITQLQGDVTDLEGRVSTNETNITNLDNRVTTNETNITQLQGDVTDLEGRVSTNETNITNLDNRVTTNETNITQLQGDVTDLEGRVSTNETNITNLDNRVTTNETNITNLQGEVVESGHMDGNTLVLVKNNQQTVEVDGIATTDDVDEVQQQVDENRENIQKESSERKAEDARLDNRINGVEQEISDINGRLDRLDGKIEKGVALAIAHASLKPLDYDPECKWSGAMGVGSYKGKNALAAGVFYRESKDVMYNISVSTCQGETGVGAGFSFRFK